jgi:hypothetical protein
MPKGEVIWFHPRSSSTKGGTIPPWCCTTSFNKRIWSSRKAIKECSSHDSDLVSCAKCKRPMTSMAMCKRSSSAGRVFNMASTEGITRARRLRHPNWPFLLNKRPWFHGAEGTHAWVNTSTTSTGIICEQATTFAMRERGKGRDHLRKDVDRVAWKRGRDFGLCRIGMTIRVRVSSTHWIPDPMGTGTGMIFYLWAGPVPDLSRGGYRHGYFFWPAGNPSGTRN